MKPVTAVVVGAGNRGQTYAGFAEDFPHQFKIVAVAEPRDFYREKLQRKHSLPESAIFKSWEEIAEIPEKVADCVLLCTPDRHHKDPAVAFAKKGYHILLEKPMAVTYEDCAEIVDTCKKNHVLLSVCHSLRYSPQSRLIKQIIESGAIGDVMNIQLLEPVGFYHFAHSFVRGNWNNSDTSTFVLLAKSCHDLDLISYWLGGKCTAVSSFGSLKHFRKENKPERAARRCLDCPVEESCPYSAKKIYLDRVREGHTTWPVDIITEVPDIESVTEALKSGPYGRCVYDSDNNVMDNQVVNLQFEGGATVQFSMVACTEKICQRQVRVFGTKGELSCDFGSLEVRQFDFLTQKATSHDVTKQMESLSGSRLQGHGGADYFIMEAFVNAVATNDGSKILTGPEESLRSHRLCFMAEKSRLEKKIINL